jgi:hypothetical protein
MCFCCRPYPHCEVALRVEQPHEEELHLTIVKGRDTPATVHFERAEDGSDVVEVAAAPNRPADHIRFKFEQGDDD